ncbi:MAG TPA: hypothetical protein DGC76_09990, partial [Candidatus Accumulibacter sp.]|nr:hypothetical protein [Accumulibacter sp.]
MRHAILAFLVCLGSSLASAAVINVEFKFTPFVGDPQKNEQVTTVAGTARLYINNIFFAEQEVRKGTVPVLFEAREIGPAVWLPVASARPAVSKGPNTLRITLGPPEAQASYAAQLRCAQ